MKKILVFFTVLLGSIVLLHPNVTAQETRLLASEELTEKQALYREQIGVYRDAERMFDVSKEQYIKLGTLASLEEAVSNTRNALLARSKVLITYLELLRDELANQHGVNLTEKDDALERLDTQLLFLKEHQDAVLLANDRDQLLLVVTTFAEQQDLVEDAVYRARTLVAIGKVQTVNDKAAALLSDIKIRQGQDEVTSLVVAKRERAYDEITKHVASTEQEVLVIIEDTYKRGSGEFDTSKFTQITKDLSDPYVTAQKTLGFLQELLTL